MINKRERATIQRIVSELQVLLGEKVPKIVKPKKVVPKKEPPPYDKIEAYFKEQVKIVLGFMPEISYSRDRLAIKKFLQAHSREDLKDLIDSFVLSDKAKEFGATLSTALGAHTIALWRQGILTKKKPTTKMYGVRNKDKGGQ